jgi:hypothetical protein
VGAEREDDGERSRGERADEGDVGGDEGDDGDRAREGHAERPGTDADHDAVEDGDDRDAGEVASQ